MDARITGVQVYIARAPLPFAVQDARSVLRHRAAVLVRVDTDDPALHGWGEAACFGGAEEIVAQTIRVLTDRILGSPVAPADIAASLRHGAAHLGRAGLIVSAVSGIEIALWDLLGKIAGLPVCALFGCTPKPIPVYRTLGFYRNDAPSDSLPILREDLARADLSGVSGVKLKIGRHGIDDDTARTRVAREMIGDKKILVVDANNAYRPRSALALCRAIADFDIGFVEEPIAAGLTGASARLRAASQIPIAGYELDPGYDACREYVDAGAVDIVQPDAIWSGGISECVKIGEAAARAGIELVPHNFSTPVGTAANYHVATVVGSPLLELDGTDSPLGDATPAWPGWDLRAGTLTMTGGAGLGVPDPREWMEPLLR
ncbi:mandelate racemase/muconate lactonizing enzyme family protein [Nocardia gipuzkoensis]